jgi:hypothetical protein
VTTSHAHPHYRKRGRATGNDDDVAEKGYVISYDNRARSAALPCARAKITKPPPLSVSNGSISKSIGA